MLKIIFGPVVSVFNDGGPNTSTGEGAVKFNDVIPTSAIASEIFIQIFKTIFR